jgi:hypothetical protein
MQPYLVLRSKKQSFGYLIFASIILIVIILFTRGENTIFSKLFVITLYVCFFLAFLYNFFNSKPLYIINDSGIYKGNNKLVSWAEISRFELKKTYGRYLVHRQAIIFGNKGEKITNIDITRSSLTLNELEEILNKKLGEKY